MHLHHVVLVLVFVQSCTSIENKLDKTTEILYNLTNYAIESRRIRNTCIYEKNELDYFACVKKLTSPHYGVQNRPPNYANGFAHQYQKPYPLPQNFPPYPQRPLENFRKPQDNVHNVMDVLYTISRNDALRCVPRLLCEVTSDTISSRGRQGFNLPTLPFNIDMGSIIRILSMIDLPGGSPVPFFAKAALLGYVSKGNSDSCLEAYPNCPRDPNKLVQYLNNYNGGFFRYFNGVNPKPGHNYQQNYGLINYPQNFYPRPYKNVVAEKRIQNRPAHQSSNDVVVFSDGDSVYNRVPKTLAFPAEEGNGFSGFALKKPKELPFSISEYYSNELDLQRPLPNHQATPIIFPVRTGTGDLRLDAEDLDANYIQKHYNLQNNNFVSFRPTGPNEGFYYEAPEGAPTRDFSPNKAIFSFPV